MRETHLQVHGVDLQGESVGPLRLWRFEEGDVRSRSRVVLRGLKVVAASVWDAEQWAYVSHKDNPPVVECSFRTAVEDVTSVQEFESRSSGNAGY